MDLNHIVLREILREKSFGMHVNIIWLVTSGLLVGFTQELHHGVSLLPWHWVLRVIFIIFFKIFLYWAHWLLLGTDLLGSNLSWTIKGWFFRAVSRKLSLVNLSFFITGLNIISRKLWLLFIRSWEFTLIFAFLVDIDAIFDHPKNLV